MARESSWRQGLIAYVLMVVALVAVSSDQAAQACVCARTNVENVIERADSVFEMTVTAIVWDDDFNATVYGDVIEVYKGDTPQYVSSRLTFGTSCGDPALPAVGRTVVGYSSGGFVTIDGPCDPRLDAAALASVFEPIEQPEPTGTAPLVVTSVTRPGVRLLVLDEELNVIHLAAGTGQTLKLAECPGGNTILELTADDLRQGPMAVETRSLATLEVTAAVDIERAASERGRIENLECHDEDGATFSYLVPRARGEGARQRQPGRADSVIEIWRDGAKQRIAASEAVKATVDFNGGMAYVLAPERRDRVQRWQLDSGQLDAEFKLDNMKGVDLARDKATGSVTVLAAQIDRPKNHGHGYLVRVGEDSLEAWRIKDAARPRQLIAANGSFHTIVKILGVGMLWQERGPAGALGEQHWIGFFAPEVRTISAKQAVAHRTREDQISLVGTEGAIVSERIDGVGPLAAIENPELVIDAGDIPPVFARGGLIVPGGDQPPEAARDLTSWWVLGGLAVLAMIFAGTVLAAARRRGPDADDEWMSGMTANE